MIRTYRVCVQVEVFDPAYGEDPESETLLVAQATAEAARTLAAYESGAEMIWSVDVEEVTE
jgi:hypothetical protein